LRQHRLCLVHDLRFPKIGIDVEHVAQVLLDLQRQRRVSLRMQLQPLLGAQGENHAFHGQRAVLQSDAGVLGLRALFVHGIPHQPRE